MYQLKSGSKKRLLECHPDLQLLVTAMLEDMELAVLCGYRGKEEQDAAFAANRSKVKFPNSMHNQSPSLAVDIAPMPIDWNDISRFEKMCKLAEEKANKLGIEIRLGRDFRFKDYPHIELKGKNGPKKTS